MEEKKGFFSFLFGFIKGIFKFINNYFKALVFLLILFLIFGDGLKNNNNEANLATLQLYGAITDPSDLLEKINDIKHSKNIKGVLLLVDSPGGALAPSVELSYAIKDLNKHKKVVAYAAGTMASGSYYASIWSDKIYANAGSIIGSIGVIFQGFNIEQLAQKLGIEDQTIKAGKYKEAGTFTRKWTDDEKQSLQVLINDSYDLFVNDVANARGLKVEDKHNFADAKVFIAKKAKNVGLVDEVGTIDDAKNYLIQASHVQNPIWQESDKVDKFIDKFINKSSKSFINIFYGLKAY